MSFIGKSLALLVVLAATMFMHHPPLSQALEPSATVVTTPTSVITASAVNGSNGLEYRLGNNAVHLRVPVNWNLAESLGDAEYLFTDKTSEGRTIYLFVSVNEAWFIYYRLTSSKCRCIVSPDGLLESLSFDLPTRGSYKLQNVRPVKVGMLSGYQLEGEGIVYDVYSRFDYRAASLPDGQVILLSISSTEADWGKAQEAFLQVLNSVTVTEQFPTLHPLLKTATALQKQIDALTPTPTESLLPNKVSMR